MRNGHNKLNLKKEALALLALLIIGLFSAQGCMKTRPINYGVIATSGVVITAEDGSFTLKSGERFTPPFQTAVYDGLSRKLIHYSDAQIIEKTRPGLCFFSSEPQSVSRGIASLGATAERYGAIKVRVSVPEQSGKEPLYGKLIFSKVLYDSSEPVTGSYRVQLPQSYVESAMKGESTVLYEYYAGNYKTWVLWLSDSPF